MKISLDVGENPRMWERMLNFFVQQCMIRSNIAGSSLPDLYNSRITYKRETGEYWQRPEETNALGYGDCEDLSIYRVCELRRKGVPARCLIRRSRNNPHQYHCVVLVFPGIIEDPSALRGMYGFIPGLAGDAGTPGMMPGMMPGTSGMMPGMMPLMMTPYGAAAAMAMPLLAQGATGLKTWWKRRKQKRNRQQ